MWGCSRTAGCFSSHQSNLLRWLFSPETLNELPRPLWAVAVAPTVSLADGTALTWRDATYRVLRSLEFRFDTAPIYRLMLIEPVA
jgi:hypothetical protein